MLLGLSNTAGVLAGVLGTAATGFILQKVRGWVGVVVGCVLAVWAALLAALKELGGQVSWVGVQGVRRPACAAQGKEIERTPELAAGKRMLRAGL